MNQIMKPSEIEKKSFAMITQELGARTFPEGQSEVIKRVIHTTADFDYAENLCFSADAICAAKTALSEGATIVTDTTMALSGINKTILAELGGTVRCFMAEPEVAEQAKARGITRAAVSMEYASKLSGNVIFAVGNAPTALIRLHELIEEGVMQAGVGHWGSGWICQCRGVQGVVSWWNDTLYYCTWTQGRKQCCSRNHQCTAISNCEAGGILSLWQGKKRSQLLALAPAIQRQDVQSKHWSIDCRRPCRSMIFIGHLPHR